jgi:hypothetical protein
MTTRIVTIPVRKESFMKSGAMIAALLLAAWSPFAFRATAQQRDHHQGAMAPSQHQEMENLVDQLARSFSALETEKDHALLEKKLAEHSVLLKTLQARFQQNSAMAPKGKTSAHCTMMQHGEKGMGFSQTQTSHHFFLKNDGGSIQVEANDALDTNNRDLIRAHLAHIALAFAAGDFSDPLAVHDQVPSAVPILQQLKGAITYTFEQMPRGGRVRIHTNNPRALDAIHDFLRFQVSEHQTGDSLNVN